MRHLVGWLLHVANTSPPCIRRAEFYAMKARLCERFGERVGTQWQEITKECYGCDGTGRHGASEDGDDRDCYRCGGTGVYDRFWSELEVWQVGRHRFHRPRGKTWRKPDAPIEIHGYIRHADRYGRGADEALLWLALAFDRPLFWALLTGYCSHGRYLWPFKLVQRVAMPLAMRLRLHRCSCGRTWRQWFSREGGWLICKQCRERSRAAWAVTVDDDEMPL